MVRLTATVIKADVTNDSRGSTLRPPLLGNHIETTFEPYLFCSVNPMRATLRGFHMQIAPYEETKLITCLAGTAFLAVFNPEVRGKVPQRVQTFQLSPDTEQSVLVGAGLATAWLTLEDDTVILYQIDGTYVPEAATGFRYDDPRIGVRWPVEPAVIAEKDLRWEEVVDYR